MKTSLNWLKDFIDIDLAPEAVGDILTSTGLEVEGLEQVDSIPGGLRGVVVGHVVECGRHPNADRLSLTKVDVGDGEPLSIVCGAPNVAAGQKVLVATVGTELHPTGGEPFTIKKGKIRGEVSAGMICAEDELGLGTDHDGILVLPAAAPVGQPAADYYDLPTDYVFDIGLTPNRSDATNHLGVAFDLAAALRINHGGDGQVKRPDVSGFAVADNPVSIPVEVRNPAACPRYAGVVLTDLKIGESPDWLKARLHAIGVRPINNVVDITNYVLHELGQPLHAFDLDKVAGEQIIVETLPQGTPFTTLDEVERELHAEDLMICDGEEKGMCIGGVFGGIGSGVTDGTTRIFLESAHFDPGYIRRTSMRHNLRTDAAKVFEKGSDPDIVVYALKRAALLMRELAGATIASEIVDIYPEPIARKEVTVRYARINQLIGHEITRQEVRGILEAMDMTFVADSDEQFTVAVPTNKADVLREVDVIEEILRIYGFNNVPIGTKVSSSMAIAPDPDPTEVRETIGNLLAGRGFLEMMNLSLSESRYYRDSLPAAAAEEDLVFINNTSNVHLDIMRPTMLFSGLETLQRNQNRQQQDMRLFEFGRTYRNAAADGHEEVNHLSLFLVGNRQPESYLVPSEPVSYYGLKAYVHLVLERLGVTSYQVAETDLPGLAFGLRYHRGARVLVDFGQVTGALATALDLRGPIFYADFHWDNVLRSLPRQRVQLEPLNRYPSVRRDLALVIDKSVGFERIEALARKTEKKILRAVNLFDVYENEEQLGAGKRSYAVSFTFENPEQTLRDKEVDKVINKLIATFEQQLGAEIRR
jgi:phenylalanyl-tRNA synthetase beta chain